MQPEVVIQGWQGEKLSQCHHWCYWGECAFFSLLDKLLPVTCFYLHCADKCCDCWDNIFVWCCPWSENSGVYPLH